MEGGGGDFSYACSPSLRSAGYLLSILVASLAVSLIWLLVEICVRVAVRGHKGSLCDRGMKYCPKCAIFFRSDEKIFVFAVVRSLELEPITAAQGTEIGVQSVIES